MTWTRVYDGSASGIKISQIAVSSVSSDLVWVGRNNGSLLMSTNATSAPSSWSSVTWTGKPGRAVLSILLDPSDTNKVYVGYGGYNTGNLWRSSDGGATWTNIGNTLPPSPVRTIERHPSDPLKLYVGTEVGIFTSGDGGTTWTTTNDGPANTSVEKLFWLDAGTLVASTHGRGMFKTVVGPVTTSMLTVSKSGSGSVTSSPTGISCGSMCSTAFTTGSTVTLTATPSAGYLLSGWGGACSGTQATCAVTLDAAKSVSAAFALAPVPYTLSVVRSGTGSGTVTSSPAGINCGATCSASYTSGTSVTLTASPVSGSVFSGWSGACSGTQTTCTVSMTASRSVTASFNPTPVPYTLSVTKSGTGSGSVTSSPAGISCGNTCSASFNSGTSVKLTAKASTASVFAGWSGACAGTSSSCTVTMSAARSVGALFNPR